MNTEALELMKPSRIALRKAKKMRTPKHKRAHPYNRSKMKIKEI